MKRRMSSPRRGSSRKLGVSETLFKMSTALLLVALSVACATSSPHRRQIVLYSEAEMIRQGEDAYRQMPSELPMGSDPHETTHVKCVEDHVVAALELTKQAADRWEFNLFNKPRGNAFAVPGGKIGIHKGLFDVAYNQDQGSEADAMGLMPMAIAGFDHEHPPCCGKNWFRSRHRAPQSLATRPSPETRLTTLRNLMDQRLSAKMQKLSSGLVPHGSPMQ